MRKVNGMKKAAAAGIGVGIAVIVIASVAALTMMGEDTDIPPGPTTIQNEIEEAPQQEGKFIELNLKEEVHVGEQLP